MAKGVVIDNDLLESYIVTFENDEDKRVTKIVATEDLGRAVVASKDFPLVGEVILREMPLLVWDNTTDERHQYLESFLDAPEHVQNLVLDMHTPPMESDYMQSFRPEAVAICGMSPRFCALGVEKVIKLMGVSNINAHEYYGKPTEAFYEVIAVARRISSGQSALFAYGSKVAHSCCSNATYSSKTIDGCLEYKVLAPIKKGDIITFPYIDNIPSVPTHIRRQELLDNKLFFCKCERCIEMDFARLHGCRNKGCNGRIGCVKARENCDAVWLCTSCGQVPRGTIDELLEIEKSMQNRLDAFMLRMMMGLSQVHPSQGKDLIDESSRALSNTHFLTLKLMSEYSRLCASHAQGISQAVQMGMIRPNTPTPFGSLIALREKAAMANLMFVRGCECIAAKCCLGTSCPSYQGGPENHPPVYTNTVNVFHAFVDLKEVPVRLWPKGSVAMLRRYVPFCYIMFGSEDTDTKEMEVMLSTIVESQATPLPASVGASGNVGGGRTNKKKKGKRGRKKK